MKEANELERIIWIHNTIKTGSLSKEDYLFKFGGKKERSFYRDLTKLQNYFHAPVQKMKGKYVYTDKTFELPQMLVSQKELAALFSALSIVKRYKDTPIYSVTKRIVQKLADDSILNELFGYNIGNLNKKEIALDWDIFNRIAEAIINNKTIIIDYHSLNSRERSERKVDPYHLYTYEEEIYLAAYCHKNKEIRDFNLNRIYSIKETNETFSSNFDRKKYFSKKNWGIIKSQKIEKVRLKIKSSEVEWVIEDFPNRFKKVSDESEWSEYEIETSLSDEFVNWIIFIGENIVVVEPKYLKTKILEKMKKILKNYKIDIL